MSESANKRSDRGRTLLRLCVAVGILIGIIVLFWPNVDGVHPHARRVACVMNLRTLGVALSLYAEEHGGVYPPADKWCDLLTANYAQERSFRCPSGGKGRCHYAMNPHVTSQSDPNVVLLFESAGGWNQSGGPELLTTEHHEGKYCNVLFVDDHVEHVKTEGIPRLRWEGEKENGQPSVPSTRPP